MRLLESRRLTGPHLLLDRAGAAAEIALEPGDDVAALVEAARLVVEGLGWPWRPARRDWTGGVSLAFEAPEDQLDTAAWVFDHLIDGEPTLDGLAAMATAERRPALLALLAEAAAAGLPALWDEHGLTLGLGARGRTWPLDALPDGVPDDVGRVPFCFITGTNGKTTTTRLVSRMVREAGLRSGHTSSDGVCIGSETVERGDWTGPGAARRVLRDGAVDVAVLETARGGLMRRGLVVTGADVVVVTNVSEDHLGEWGIEDLAATAQMKLVVAKGLRPGGALVCNAECAPLVEAAAPLGPLWFGVEPAADRAAFVRDGWIVAHGEPLVPLAEVPITLGGAARFNVENALAAALVGLGLGLPRAAVAAGLRGLRPDVADNAGRMNVLPYRGATAIVDFAHNPDGVRQLGAVVRALPAARRLVVLGQAGDRRDEDVIGLVDAIVAIGFDRIVLKDLPDHRRGKAPGEVPARLRALLRERGVRDDQLDEGPDELDAIERALAWSQPGDLLLLLVHERFDEAVARLREG
jgi:UDP-N-acetylmuramyl tripeptide synthase